MKILLFEVNFIYVLKKWTLVQNMSNIIQAQSFNMKKVV